MNTEFRRLVAPVREFISEREALRILKVSLSPTEDKFLSFVRENNGRVKEDLSRARDILRKVGEPAPRPAICSTFLKFSIVYFLEQKSVENGGVDILVKDVTLGAGIVANAFFVAVQEIENKTEEGFQKLSSEPTDSRPLEDRIKAYLLSVNYAQRAADKLKEDPTGFSLIDYVVDEMLQKEFKLVVSRSFAVPEFVWAGADFARRVYKEIYPFTENLPTAEN